MTPFRDAVHEALAGRPDVILLDIGGVLTPDPWQALLLTPGRGIADRLALDPTRVEEIANRLWPHFSLQPRTERDWWEELGRQIDSTIPQDLVRDVEAQLLRPFNDAHELIEDVRLAGDIGVISDNTAFWYAKQSALLRLESRTDVSRRYLSFEFGVSKTSRPVGLFEIAADRLPDRRVLVLDDREANCDRARAVGFSALLVTR